MNTLAAFVAVAAVVIVTPGQDTALVIKNTLAGRRAAGIATAFGVSAGQAVWALATSAGLAALIVASESLFLALKLVGAAYLVYLGLHSLWNAIRRRSAPHPVGRAPRLGRWGAFRQGVLSNLANPKMAVFFTSLLPQFAEDGRFLDLLALGLLFALLTVTWLIAYAIAIERASNVLRHPSIRRALDAVTGIVLVALGLRLATERR
ncbi:MAG TPA: LysE family translocator [Gaiella sp.]|jgi:threonine/homoserine/homoserine lactone efflux protein|nr:LysE family translocator [Gaiella sp.]